MPKLSELTDYQPAQVTPSGRLYVSPNMPTSDDSDGYFTPIYEGAKNVVKNIDAFDQKFTSDVLNAPKNLINTDVAKRIADRLLGLNGEERYQLWPEKVIRSALTAIPDAYSGKIPMHDVDPETGELVPSQAMIGRAMDMATFAGAGGVAGTGEGGVALGAGPSLRPALKYKDRLYKGKEGQEHQDVIPPHLYPEFQQMAMNGEDISHYNFGFVNDKGHFLSREDALKYGIDTGLIDPQAGKYGALTSTLMADSSRPGTAIEAMKTVSQYPLAKPADRWTNTLGQNDHLMQTMTPDEFLNKSRPLKVDAESRENIDAIKQHIKEGKPLDPLELHANGKEDGRHRALAAKELGIKQVPVINFRPSEPFYSAVEHTVNSIPQAKMNGEAWLGTLANKPGVKPEELDWTGLKSFLEENKGKPVTKEQVQEHLAANKIELREVSKGELSDADILAQSKIRQEDWDKMSQSQKELIRSNFPVDKTKYHSYQLPGGENYREMLMTLPNKQQRHYEYEYFDPKTQTSKQFKTEAEAKAAAPEGAVVNPKEIATTNEAYRSSHWDEPNILAHVRMNDRTIEGKKSLHLEEIQSDWHQQGRDKGYRPEQEKKLAELVKQREDLQKEASVLSTEDDRYKEIYAELPKLQSKINDIGSGGVGVPDAPFKKSWHELALKRMLREAAEKGYDRLSWTPGEAQAARYDLSKSVDKLYYDPELQGGTLAAEGPNGRTVLDKQGIKPDQIADYVGKEAAKKLLETERDANGLHALEGQQLKIGGEGMKGFYDQIIPKALEKLGKEHGVKVQKGEAPTGLPKSNGTNQYGMVKDGDKYYVTDINNNRIGPAYSSRQEANNAMTMMMKGGGEKGQPVHYIDLPQSLKDRAMQKGFPLFSSAYPGYIFKPVDGDPFKDKK